MVTNYWIDRISSYDPIQSVDTRTELTVQIPRENFPYPSQPREIKKAAWVMGQNGRPEIAWRIND